MKSIFVKLLFLTLPISGLAQNDTLLKIHHAEPLYIDLIRDLGARKGEREWNTGYNFDNIQKCFIHSGFVEYEFSPMNRLGLEIEIPFSFTQAINRQGQVTELPKHRIEGIKTAMQYTFLVNKKTQTSMAIGYMNEIKFHSFNTISVKHLVIKGNEYNPFFITAKRWGKNFHSLIYTGPALTQLFTTQLIELSFQFNASLHYVIPSTQNFIGIEFNQESNRNKTEMVLHPQMKIKLNQGLFLGLVAGIGLRSESKYSLMFRMIYEPKRKNKLFK